MHPRPPHIKIDAINWQPAWRELTRHDPVLFVARVSRAIYYDLHSTPTELRYDADGTHHKRSKACLLVPTLATVCSRGRISMPLPASSRAQFTADLTICRILNGMWQVSGAHGVVDPVRAVDAMSAYHEAGFTTWDLADHYGPAEDFIGDFRRRFAARHGANRLPEIQAFTKWVPRPGRITRRVVEDAIRISLTRMGVECLDLLQFHWWDYNNDAYLDALKHLCDLQQEGRIRHLGLTNFDTERLSAIAHHGVRVVSNQVQYSLVDRRPEVRMARFCSDHRVTLLAYGTLLGGLLSEKYLGRSEPRRSELNTASLQKYKNMLDAWGDWPLFQELLAVLQQIADKHGVSIANVGVRYVLDRPAVAGVIVGARLGVAQHLTDNARVFAVRLDADDLGMIEAVLAKSRDLTTLIGDCGDEYRS
jgi:aryl-alcohol dehydrogenase-like predicted oxidoreductase